MSRARVVAVAVIAVVPLACSGAPSHPPPAANDCSGPGCSAGYTIGGGTGPSGAGGATPGPDAGVVNLTGCIATSGVTLCSSISTCASFAFDRTKLPSCGFLPDGLPAPACLCQNGTTLCTTIAGAACSTVATTVAKAASAADLCATLSTAGTCTSATCEASCQATCKLDVACIVSCRQTQHC